MKESPKDDLAKAFMTPPRESNAWCYWWWLNGAASKEGIARDFEEMRRQGISGALLFDAGEAGPEAPRGPKFMSPEWRELYRHALREADRCGITLGVNLCSGWNAGGPWVTQEHAAKKLVSAQAVVEGAGRVRLELPKPPTVQGFYRDIAVLAAPQSDAVWDRSRVVDVTRFVDPAGRLDWEAPKGRWKILRIGSTLDGHVIACVGSGPGGLEIDPMSAEAMDAHFAETGAKLIADAGPLAGKSLQYFHIDSWELGQPTWTPKMREEFQRRRGYDPLPWLPAVLGQTVDNAAETRRFLQDYRRTAADLVAANYYGRLRELTLKGGLRGIHPESGGPFFGHWIDPLQCEGINDIPMGEFWKRNTEPNGPIVWHRNPSLKQAATAAHIYGKPVCQAEAYTSFGCDWMDDPWSMKDIGDAAFCEGLTRNVLCFWVHQSRPDAKPGFQWAHVGTHFDCNLTWWPMSSAWLTYLARCQHMLRQGLFVADFACLQSEAIPGFLPGTTGDPSKLRPSQRPAGFDYDAINADVLLTRAKAGDGRLVLPDGMSYRYLVLPHEPDAILSPATLKKVHELAEAGVTVIGPKTLVGSVAKTREGPADAVARADGLAPDIEIRSPSPGASFDWIHRRDGQADIYFISNQSALDATAQVVFRATDRQPELWDPITGGIRDLPDYREEDRRTVVPLRFAPRQSWFVVFRKEAVGRAQGSGRNFAELKSIQELAGTWEVQFDPKWFYPDNGTGGKVRFDQLTDWSKRPEEAIRHYSGTATYRTTFEFKAPDRPGAIYLDLGAVKNVARVRLNGNDLGVVWTAPWRVEITGAVKSGANELQIEVANLWPNRLIGDATLPKEKRLTATNVRTYDTLTSSTYGCRSCEDRKKTGKPAELLPSGLLGPVRLLQAE